VRLKLEKRACFALLAACFMLVSCLAYPSTLKVEGMLVMFMKVGQVGWHLIAKILSKRAYTDSTCAHGGFDINVIRYLLHSMNICFIQCNSQE
jgi:hypothetical protein